MIRIKRVNENFGGEVCEVIRDFDRFFEIMDNNISIVNGKYEGLNSTESSIVNEQIEKLNILLSETTKHYLKGDEVNPVPGIDDRDYKLDTFTVKSEYTKIEIYVVKLIDDYYLVSVGADGHHEPEFDRNTGRYKPSLFGEEFAILCDDIDGLKMIAETAAKEMKKK